MEFEVMPKKDAKRITAHFHSRYSVPEKFFEGKSFLKNRNFVWLCSNSCLEALKQNWKKHSMGLLFLLDEKTFKPTTFAMRLLGSQVKRNALELSESEMARFLSGKKFALDAPRLEKIDSTGYAAALFAGRVVGSIWVEKEKGFAHPNVSRTKPNDYFEGKKK